MNKRTLNAIKSEQEFAGVAFYMISDFIIQKFRSFPRDGNILITYPVY